MTVCGSGHKGYFVLKKINWVTNRVYFLQLMSLICEIDISLTGFELTESQ